MASFDRPELDLRLDGNLVLSAWDAETNRKEPVWESASGGDPGDYTLELTAAGELLVYDAAATENGVSVVFSSRTGSSPSSSSSSSDSASFMDRFDQFRERLFASY